MILYDYLNFRNKHISITNRVFINEILKFINKNV